MEFYCVAGLDWTYFDVQCGIGGLHVGQVCLCHPQILPELPGLNVMAAYCVLTPVT